MKLVVLFVAISALLPLPKVDASDDILVDVQGWMTSNNLKLNSGYKMRAVEVKDIIAGDLIKFTNDDGIPDFGFVHFSPKADDKDIAFDISPNLFNTIIIVVHW